MFSLPEKFRTGLEVVDQQHAKLLDLLDQGIHFLRKEKTDGFAGVEDFLQALRTYTRIHFQYEEKEMKKASYPQLADQQQMHAYFLKKIHELDDKNTESEREKVREIIVFLKEWFIGHIVEKDLAFGDFLNKQKSSAKSKL